MDALSSSRRLQEGGGVTVDSKPVGNDSAFSIKSVEALNVRRLQTLH